MKKRILFIIGILISVYHFGQDSCAENFKKTEEKTQQENKKILLYFSGSDWCKPCIMMKKNVLDNPKFQNAIQNKYTIFQIDFPQNQKELSPKEIKCREKLAAQFNKNGIFPKLVLLDKNKKIIKEINGYQKEEPKEILHQLENRK